MTHFAQTIKALGCHSGWVSDHICWPADIESKYPYADDGAFPATSEIGWLDAIGTQLFVAGVTETLRLGFSVLILPYRMPVVTAKQLASLDVLSSGRLILGAGIGWMSEEAEVLGMPWDQRGRRAAEQLQLLQTLFSDAEPEFSGNFYQLPCVAFEPKPLQKRVPLWIGGSSDAAFRRAARFETGFQAAFQPLDTVVNEFALVKRFAEAGGRDPDSLTLSLRVFLDPSGAMEAEKSISGSHSQLRDRVGELADAGIEHVLLDPVARGGVQSRLDAVADFMENVAHQHA